MKINLETDEEVELVIDGTCEFERNGEGTMIIKSKQRKEKLK